MEWEVCEQNEWHPFVAGVLTPRIDSRPGLLLERQQKIPLTVKGRSLWLWAHSTLYYLPIFPFLSCFKCELWAWLLNKTGWFGVFIFWHPFVIDKYDSPRAIVICLWRNWSYTACLAPSMWTWLLLSKSLTISTCKLEATCSFKIVCILFYVHILYYIFCIIYLLCIW